MDEEKGAKVQEESSPPEEARDQSEASPENQAQASEGREAVDVGEHDSPDSSSEPDGAPQVGNAGSSDPAGESTGDNAPDADAGPASEAGDSPRGGDRPQMSEEELAAMTDEEREALMNSGNMPPDQDSKPDDDPADQANSENEASGSGLLSQEDIDNAIRDQEHHSSEPDGSGSDSQESALGHIEYGISDEDVKKADFQQLSPASKESRQKNIELLMDVDLPVSIELGRTRMAISDILALSPGSVVELDKLVGEPVDLLVNQKCVARGEVVVVEENFGLRITELVSQEERIKNLQ
jgi:flagellar motor switch protein FliN